MKIAFFDTKPYDMEWFNKENSYGYDINYFETKLHHSTVLLASGCEAVVVFVNDTLDAKTVNALYDIGIRLIALRCAGYNNVDFKAAYQKIHVVRVPEYSPYAVAEHAAALMLSCNRKIHKAYTRTRDNNFSLLGLMGMDLHGKTIGVIGTGKIGRVFINICKGMGMKVLAYDPYPAKDADFEYAPLQELYHRSDVISLHCPLTRETRHMINEDSIAQMKQGVMIINTSRGALIDSEALVEGLKGMRIGGAALDVYEEESDYFFEDLSNQIMQDDTLSRLISFPNVIVTSHQAFFTREAMEKIASITLSNIHAFKAGDFLQNEICYMCSSKGGKDCRHETGKNCF